MSAAGRVIVKLIEFYQNHISKRKGYSCCRFSPSCSAYAIEAVKVHGAFKGSFLAIGRVLRCNPLFKGGYDPVPEKKNKK